jgi:hypothetical protein
MAAGGDDGAGDALTGIDAGDAGLAGGRPFATPSGGGSDWTDWRADKPLPHKDQVRAV